MYIDERKETHSHEYKRNGKKFAKRKTRTFVIFNCDLCNSKFERLKGACHGKNNNNHKHFCSSCSSPSVIGAVGRKNKSKIWMKKVGEKQIDACGYMTVYMANTHSYSDGYCGRLREHILIMENHLGRSLQKGEVVHHIDGNKLNNDINNLDLCTVQEHNNCHAKSEEIVFKLVKMGLVEYDRNKKLYILKDEL